MAYYSGPIQLLKELGSWNENVTWDSRPQGTSDITGFIDQGNVSIWKWNSNDYPTLKSVVQGWKDNSSTNYGFTLWPEYNKEGVVFYTREHSPNPSYYPKLIVQYTPPPLDTTAPTPNPMTWSTEPYATSSSSITMIATVANDSSGVEYYFAETSGNPGGSDSGWQDSTTYTNTGLQAGTPYTYKVKARDKSTNHNETGYSSPKSATTLPYTLTVNSSVASSVSISSSTGHEGTTNYARTVTGGTSVNLQAPQYVGSGASRMRFNGWTGSVNSSDQSITFNMDGNKTVTANYVSDPESVLRPMTVDLNNDGIPNFYDFSVFATFWQNTSCSPPNWCNGSDFDKNGIVDIYDLQIFAEFWLWPVADLDIDGDVDFDDYAALANQWMAGNCAEPDWCSGADFNKSGSVDLYDLGKFVEYWLEGTTP